MKVHLKSLKKHFLIILTTSVAFFLYSCGRDDLPEGYDPATSAPLLELNASKTELTQGESFMLSWRAINADTLVLS